MISQFSVSVKCRLGSKLVSEVSKAEKVLVVAAKAAGKDRIVDLCRHEDSSHVLIAGSDFSSAALSFEFQKVTYSYSPETDSFERLEYPSIGSTEQFVDSVGHKTPQDIGVAMSKWGQNDFDIRLPDLLDLYVVRES